jgi:hypothetical protein
VEDHPDAPGSDFSLELDLNPEPGIRITPEGNMIDLKAAYGGTYRIALDQSATIPGQSRADRLWLLQIPCRYGHIYVHGIETLGAYAAGRLIAGKLAALRGIRVHQRGDSEVTVVFPPEEFPAVASLLQARKRRRVSDEQARAGAERLARYRHALVNQAGG